MTDVSADDRSDDDANDIARAREAHGDVSDMPTEELISRVQLIEEQPLDTQAAAFTQLHAELLQELQA